MTSAAPPADPLVGTQLGARKLQEKIGDGPRASVYLAAGDPPLAVKILSPEMAADFAARCFDAAESARRIQHPCVVRVVEVGRAESRGYIVHEHAAGGSLEKLLESERRLPFERATRILRDASLGLEAAHRAGVVHHNLRPTNVLFDAGGRAKIADFGQGWQPKLGSGLGKEDPILGSVEYLAPEQVQGQLPDMTTDLYQLGLIYYKMLTSKLPFPGVDDREIAMNRVQGPPRPVRESFPGVDPRAIPIVDKLLAKNPSDRFQNARALLAVIEPLVKGKTSKTFTRRDAPLPDASVIPSEVRHRLSLSSAAAHFGPGLGLLMIAGLVAPGGDGYFASVASLVTSKVSLILAGVGLAAMAIGCLLLRKDLLNSGRARVILGLIALAALCAAIGTAALDRALWRGSLAVLAAPVNLLFAAGGLAWFGLARSLEQDEETQPSRAPKMALGLAVLLWYAGWAAGNTFGPFKAIGSSIETVAPLIMLAAAGLALGFIATTTPSVKPRVRRIGLGLLALAGLSIMVWCAAGAAEALQAPSRWPGAVFSHLASLPVQIPRSGAPMLLAVLLIATADFVLRGGLIRHYAKK
jgi:hypothetical protein